MALLRWIHLRKLVPLTDLIQALEGRPPRRRRRPPAVAQCGAARRAMAPPRDAAAGRACARRARRRQPRPRRRGCRAVEARPQGGRARPKREAPAAPAIRADVQPCDPAMLKDASSRRCARRKKFFYGTVVAQAQRIDFDGDRVVFTFAPQHRALRVQLERIAPGSKRWRPAPGRKMTVVSAEGAAAAAAARDTGAREPPVEPAAGDRRAGAASERALADTDVQAMLERLRRGDKDIEEM